MKNFTLIGRKFKTLIPEDFVWDWKKFWAILGWAVFFICFAYCLFGVSLHDNLVNGVVNPREALISAREYWIPYAIGIVGFILCVSFGPKPNLSPAWKKIIYSICAGWLLLEIAKVTSYGTGPNFFSVQMLGGETTAEFFYTYDATRQLMDIGNEVAWVLFLYTFFFVIPKIAKTDVVQVLLWVFIIAGLISVFYTYRPEEVGVYRDIIEYFKNPQGQMPAPEAFYGEKNSYAYMLFLGATSCMVLNGIKKRTWLYLPLELYFGISILFTSCKTLYILGLVFVPVYFIWRMIVAYRKHPKGVIIGCSLLLLALIALFIVFMVMKDQEGNIFHSLWSAIGKLTDHGENTMNSRFCIWRSVLSLMGDPYRMIFGYGYTAADDLSRTVQGAFYGPTFGVQRTAHNGLLDIFLRYGLLGLFAWCGLMAYSLYAFYKLCQTKDRDLAIDCALVFACFLAYSTDESKVPFYRDIASLPYIAIPLLPVFGKLVENNVTLFPERKSNDGRVEQKA